MIKKENENKANNVIYAAQPNPQNFSSSNHFQPQTKQVLLINKK